MVDRYQNYDYQFLIYIVFVDEPPKERTIDMKYDKTIPETTLFNVLINENCAIRSKPVLKRTFGHQIKSKNIKSSPHLLTAPILPRWPIFLTRPEAQPVATATLLNGWGSYHNPTEEV